MRTKFTFLIAAIAAIVTGNFNETNAQNVSPYWSLSGNSNASASSKLGTTNSISLRFVTKNAERMRIDTNGNVGIGVPNTTIGTISSKLMVNSASGTRPFQALINNSAKLTVNTNGGISIGSASSGPANGLYVSGSVGIGTAAPVNILDIQGGNNWDVSSTEGDVRIGNSTYRLKIGVATAGLGAGDAEGAVGGTNRIIMGANDALSIDGAGNVGVGTIAPVTRFEVKRNDGNFLLARFSNSATTGDRTALIDIQNGNATPVLWRYGVGGTGNGLGISNGQFYIERSGAGALLSITTGGNVGIGTINPLYKLSVNGTIQAKEVRVETGWADYVFEKDYKLNSLEDVAKYIEENKHLPDVPSAKEVETNGLKLAEMNSIMMRKIEELTLYVINQNKEIQQLHKQMDQLQKKTR